VKVTFAVLQQRLITAVNNRVRNGDFTERGLARILGISQPQIHNILKGARKLKPEFADRILAKFGMTILDLLHDGEISAEMLSRETTRLQVTFQRPGYSNLRQSLKRPADRELSLGRIPRREAS
jgi:hypothetical protein